MPRFATVTHQEWIAAPVALVRRQFADLHHHIDAQVHPRLRFEVLAQGPRTARFVQEIRLLGVRQRDVFERSIHLDGSMTDLAVEGFNQGGSLDFSFFPETRGAAAGTLVEVTIRLPLPPVLGGLLKPLLQARLRKELRAAAAEDKHDIEVRGYPRAAPQAPALRAA